jgi:Polyketide cyclase / dehydrase and lipid transport
VPALRVSIVLDASPEEVWRDLEQLGSHTEWMQDAVAIDFTTGQRQGVGTEFDCATRIGPVRLTDHMAITSWLPGREMGVRHVGLITGSGVFTLRPAGVETPSRAAAEADPPPPRTHFEWTERLVFPWWLGGPLGAFAARPVLRHVWRANLRNLQARFVA